MEFSDLKKLQDFPESALISQKVIPYLYGRGCKYFNSSVDISVGHTIIEADLIVYLDEKKFNPYIVVEVKKNLPNELTLLDPAVQKAFSVAAALNTSIRYLLVTNGDEYYWFERSSKGLSLIQLAEPPDLAQQAHQLTLFEEKLIPISDPEEFLKIMQSVIETLAREGVVFGLRMATEINRILLAKLKDEENLSANGQSIFNSNSLWPEEVARNIEYLYKAALEDLEGISIHEVSVKEGLWLLSMPYRIMCNGE
jgi:Type I restriction enzyme R protein N terminus (HSDR_N)